MLFRLNLIKTWIILKLKEFNKYQKEVYDMLDDWIVVAVDKENQAASAITNKLAMQIQD